ncbi:MAG: BT4734/BF3469 family protein, partial [Prevotella sp.]|nr:BT4734/BF3469 family protein [Prevotella sp.]
MNEIEYFSSLTETVPQRRSWETVATEIRTSDSLADLCRRYRTLLASNDKTAMKAIKTKCPAIMPQVTLDGGRASANITGYLPYMIIDIDHIPAERMQTVEKQVKDD